MKIVISCRNNVDPIIIYSQVAQNLTVIFIIESSVYLCRVLISCLPLFSRLALFTQRTSVENDRHDITDISWNLFVVSRKKNAHASFARKILRRGMTHRARVFVLLQRAIDFAEKHVKRHVLRLVQLLFFRENEEEGGGRVATSR